MGSHDSNYQIVYRGEMLDRYEPGGWVFFQRQKECGGGYWLGRTCDGVFIMELEYPVSLHDGIVYLNQLTRVSANFMDFDDDLLLTWSESA